MPNFAFGAVAIALINLVVAIPSQAERFQRADVANRAWTIDQRMLAAFDCLGQSCMIADTAGSTGRKPTLNPEGPDESDTQCVVKHNPEAGQLLQAYNNQPPDVPKQNTTWVSEAMKGLNKLLKPFSNPRTTGTFNGNCSPNILIFAKGTLEPGILGVNVGPQISAGLPTNWTTVGVDYDPDIAGDFCLGLPGGMVAKDVINAANKKCPSSNLFLSGSSQGAMVARNGLARADDAAKAKVKGVVTFGDPFNGSPIKGYNGPIHVFCVSGDGVCTGNFEVTLGHLSYIFDATAAVAIKKLLEMANGGGDSNCCHPQALPELPSPEMWAKSIAANGGKVPKPKPGTTIEQWLNALSKSGGTVPEFSVRSKLGISRMM